MSQLNAKRRGLSARGFTMIELMVALTISMFIVITVYFVMASSTTSFRVQNDAALVSDRLTYSMDTIKNDIRRSSFMSVPNMGLPIDQYPWYQMVCAAPGWFSAWSGATGQALWMDPVTTVDRANGYYLPSRARDQIVPGQNPDRLVLLGAYRADEPFRPTFMQAGASTMRIDNGTTLFTDMQYMFDDAFISLTSPAGGTQFLRVTGVAAHASLPETILTLSAPVVSDPSDGTNPACNFAGFGGANFEVVPLHFVRYSLQEDADVPGETLLVREELDGSMGDLTTASRYVVARNIVDIQVWFDGVVAGTADAIVRDGEDGSGSWVDTAGSVADTLVAGDAASQPENLRYAYVQLSARLSTTIARDVADDAEQGLREWIELRANNGGTPTYLNEFTRVVTIRSEVEMPNIALAQTTSL